MVNVHEKHIQRKTDHRSLWWNDDHSSEFVPILNTNSNLYVCESLDGLTLMLLVANFSNTKWCKKAEN